MDGIYVCGCGCKEVYRFPHITYPYSSYISVLFCSSIPTFCSFFLIVCSSKIIKSCCALKLTIIGLD